jgi:hypothetical protein
MKLQLAGIAALTMVAGGFFGSPAAAATTITVCPSGCDQATIQAAVNAASAGDTIDVLEDITVAGQTTVNKDVTVTSSTGSTVTQTATAITFLMNRAGSTLSGLTITSNAPKAREFVQIGANDVSLLNNTIYGPPQAPPMSSWTSNRGLVTQGGITGFLADGNTIHSMRSGAYLNPNGTGTISNNTLHNTKGDFLIDNSAFTFTGNEAGEGAASEWGFVIFASTAIDRYTDLPDLSRSNGYMTAWDQRTGETYIDADRDNANDRTDNCVGVANADQADADGDGTGDACEPDTDGDGVIDDNDAFPGDPTETTDSDNDGVGNNRDNCVNTANAGQADLDRDGLGDACDNDIDGDGVPNNQDKFPNNPAESKDADNDGIGDNADTDDDNDGLPDRLDTGSKEDCKNGGWAYFTTPKFKNQGACVSHFAKQK